MHAPVRRLCAFVRVCARLRAYPGRTDALLVQYREVVTALIVQPVEFAFSADLLFVAEHDDTNGKACIQILWIRCFVYGRDKQC